MFAILAAAALPLMASALTVTSPNQAGWEGNTTVLVSWQWQQTDPNFSCELGNTQIASGLLAAGPIAVCNNIVPNTNSLTFELPVIPPSADYWLALVAVDDVNTVYANSSLFSIYDNPHSSAITVTSTVFGQTTGSHSTSKVSTTSGVKNSTTTSTGSSVSKTGTTTTGITTEQITTLAVTTLSTSTTATSSTGAAVRGASFGGLLGLFGFVGAVALGA